MADNPKPKIFLSYAWANSDLADEIDTDFKKFGMALTRDVRDLGYRKSIKDFMHTVGKHDYVLMLISDEYLRSENCMYEVTELLGTHEFKERILPIVHDNARHIFNAMGSDVYLEYWKNKKQDANKFNRRHANQVSIDALKKMIRIQNEADVFFTKLTDLNIHSLVYLKQQGYRPLLDIIGFEDKHELEYWRGIKDSEQIKDFEAYLSVYPKGRFVNAAVEKISFIKKLFEEKELWEEAVKENHISKWEAFIKKYPKSRYLPEANKKLKYIIENNNKLRQKSSSKELDKSQELVTSKWWPLIIGGIVIIIVSLIVTKINKWWPFVSIPLPPSSAKMDSAKMRDAAKIHPLKIAYPNANKDVVVNKPTVTASAIDRLEPIKPNYQLIDSFDDNHNNWKLDNNTGGKAFIENGKLVINSLSLVSTYSAALKSTIDSSKDFIYSISCRQTIKGSGTFIFTSEFGTFGMLYASSIVDRHNFAYLFGIRDKYYSIRQYQDSLGSSWIQHPTECKFINKLNRNNTLTVIKKGLNLYFYINRHRVTVIPLHSRFRTEFGAYVDDITTVEFDNFKLEGIENTLLSRDTTIAGRLKRSFIREKFQKKKKM